MYMHNLQRKRRLNALEIKGSFMLPNGMYCEWGESADEGLAADVYDDASKALLVATEQIFSFGDVTPGDDSFKMFIASLMPDYEDSMVYYYGPHDRPFEESELTKPTPKKTGRFAKRH